jgi:AraC family transcriptional regulator
VSLTATALWYIETHLDSDLSLEAVAEVVGVSRFHLSRAFAVSAGVSFAGYVRARRLSLAARSLAAGAPDILAVALGAGYDSHEAFTRAFRQHFGVTPEQLRGHASTDNLLLQEPIRMNKATTTALATPRIAAQDAMLIFGPSQRCTHAGNPNIPSQWNSFLPHLGHIDGQIGDAAYGVIYNSDDGEGYDYLCGVAVERFPSVPPEFTRLRLPLQTYAVFEHHDHVSAIAGTWTAIWEHGLADAGHQASDGPAFERYGPQFDGRTGLGGFEIWVPVKA